MSYLPAAAAKGELALAYLHTVATQCRYAVDVTRLDYEQIDAVVKASRGSRPVWLAVQLKSRTESADDGAVRVRLDRQTYDTLRLADPPVPRLLLVLSLPRRWEEQVAWSAEQLALRRCMYWCNLRGLPDVGSQQTVTVAVPRRNEFGPEALTAMVDRLARHGDLDGHL